MTWSLNEVEGLARKAARGSGLSWGLAEEAGKSTRWLMAKGLPGADMLAGLLTLNDGTAYETLCPKITGGAWTGTGGALCPLITGAALCDHAATLSRGDSIRLGRTSYPMLLLPFAAGAAELTRSTIHVSWTGSAATIDPHGQITLTEVTTLDAVETDAVSVQATETRVDRPRDAVMRCEIPAPVAQALNAFAQRTYAPDTPESRMAGAGAGLTDND